MGHQVFIPILILLSLHQTFEDLAKERQRAMAFPEPAPAPESSGLALGAVGGGWCYCYFGGQSWVKVLFDFLNSFLNQKAHVLLAIPGKSFANKWQGNV